jgi:hypothetical protein
MSFNKDDYVAFTDWETGKKVYRYIDRQTGEIATGLTQNQRNKVRRASLFNSADKEIKLTATGKSEKGISKEYYNYFDSHLICRNPETILRNYRIAS